MIVAVLKCDACKRDALVRCDEVSAILRWNCSRCGGVNYIESTQAKLAAVREPERSGPSQ